MDIRLADHSILIIAKAGERKPQLLHMTLQNQFCEIHLQDNLEMDGATTYRHEFVSRGTYVVYVDPKPPFALLYPQRIVITLATAYQMEQSLSSEERHTFISRLSENMDDHASAGDGWAALQPDGTLTMNQ